MAEMDTSSARPPRRYKGQVKVQITFSESIAALRQIVNFHQDKGDGHLLFNENDANNLHQLAIDVGYMVASKPKKQEVPAGTEG